MGKDKIPSKDVCLKYIFWVRTGVGQEELSPGSDCLFPLTTKGAEVTSFNLLPKI